MGCPRGAKPSPQKTENEPGPRDTRERGTDRSIVRTCVHLRCPTHPSVARDDEVHEVRHEIVLVAVFVLGKKTHTKKTHTAHEDAVRTVSLPFQLGQSARWPITQSTNGAAGG